GVGELRPILHANENALLRQEAMADEIARDAHDVVCELAIGDGAAFEADRNLVAAPGFDVREHEVVGHVEGVGEGRAHATSPPAMARAIPLTAAASSEASQRTAAATSSGRTKRPCGFVDVKVA